MTQPLSATDLILIDGIPHQIGAEFAKRYQPGDRIIGLNGGQLLHISQSDLLLTTNAVEQSVKAYEAMKVVTAEQITEFFREFARLLEDELVFGQIRAINDTDVASAKERGRSTTRLVLTNAMRLDMIAALRTWGDAQHVDGVSLETIDHGNWSVETVKSSLGVVAFVFEGRPNVFADATGVLRSGNTCVFRIGSDALGTAQAMMGLAVGPALHKSGLPAGAVSLVDSRSHASGWALFSNRHVSLAIARGSGEAVAQLGAVARQFGIPASLHGTGGAWLIAGSRADASWFSQAVMHSLDRKVCNTLNVCCIPRSRASQLVPLFIDGMVAAAARQQSVAVVHADQESQSHFTTEAKSLQVITLNRDDLDKEWEWENNPECSLVVVDDLDEAIALFNRYAPRFIVSIVSEDRSESDKVWKETDAPFVGNGMTRWVDGQFALDKPELGLSNWQSGRILGRGGILSGDSVYSVRYRAVQRDANLHR